jgi:hypothetical protein
MPVADRETLEMILAHYQSSAAEREDEELWWRAKGLPFEQACERAAKALGENGKIHSHHRRPGRVVMANFARAVVAVARHLEQSTDFDDLLTQAKRLAKGVRGAGELVAYDVADRIGLHLGLTPKAIYLHAGTRAGAHVLGLGTAPKARAIRTKDLPTPLNNLAPRDAENVLCTYKRELLMSPEDCFHALANKQPGGCGPRPAGGIC